MERDPNLTKFNETRTTTKEWLEKSMSKWEIRSERIQKNYFTRFNESSRLGIVNSYISMPFVNENVDEQEKKVY
jgi:hypothetical protein